VRAEEAGWTVAVAVVAAFWVVAALAEGDPSPVDTTAAGAAAAAGTAAVAGAAWGFGPLRPIWLAGTVLVLLPVATAAAAEGSAPALAVMLVVLAAAVVVAGLLGRCGVAQDEGGAAAAPRGAVLAQAVAVVLAAGLLAGALAAGHEDDGPWALVADGGAAAGLALAASAVLLLAAGVGPTRGRAYAVPGLLAGFLVAPGLTDVTLAVAGGAVALLAAAVLGRRPGVALGFLGLGAAALPAGGRTAAALLLAGAALALAYGDDHPLAGLLGLPGAAGLAAEAVAAGGEAAPIVLVAAAACTAALLALASFPAAQAVQLARAQPRQPGRWPLAALPAAGLGLWLLVAPGTWSWTGASGLGPFDRGAALAAAVGVGAIVLRAAQLLQEPEVGERTTPPRSAWSRPVG
jgi:hypothetical protein